MRCCRQFTKTVRSVRRQTLNWRTARFFCALWFALTAIGFPSNLSLLGGSTFARNPSQSCHCSVAKRLSGTCCCARDSIPKSGSTCCSAKKQTLNSPVVNDCQPKTSARCAIANSPKVELSIARCDCNTESPDNMSLTQEPRLPATVPVVVLPETSISFRLLPGERVESALLLPPVPPPKLVLKDAAVV